MSLRLAAALVLCFPTFLSAAIQLGTERPLADPPVGIADGNQISAAVASSGTETLVAWIDSMIGRAGVYVAELDQTGTLLPGSQRRLSTGVTNALTLSWTGESYLALWSSFTGGGITATTLDRDGGTLVAPRAVLPAGQIVSAVEWAGGRGMFVYVLDDATYRIASIGRDGGVVRSGITIPDVDITTARVFSNGQSFLAIWQKMPRTTSTGFASDLFAARYTAEGDLLDAAPRLVATLGFFSGGWEAAFDGSRFALVLAETTTPGQSVLRRFIIDPATFAVTTLTPVDMGSTTGVRIEWDGSRFIAFWLRNLQAGQGAQTTHSYALQTVSFGADGSGDTAAVTVTSRDGIGLQPSGAWNGEALAVAWHANDPGKGGTDVYAVAVAGGTEVAPSHFPIPLAPSWQSKAAIASDGNQSLIVWLEGEPAETAPLVAAHATGGRIDSAPVYLSDNSFGPAQVVFTGAAYLVFWLERTGNLPRLVMQRLDVSGVIVDTQETFIGNAYDFGVAFNGTYAMVAYRTGTTVEAVRFESDGTPVDAAPILLPIAGVQMGASNGSDFAFAWREVGDVYAALVDASGNTINARIPVGTGDAFQHSPALASDGRDFMIAYVDGPHLVARKLLREGALGAATVLDTASRQGFFAYIARSGEGYLAGWEVHQGEQGAALRLAGLDANGTVTDAARTVADSALSGMHGALATGGGATGDLVYGRLHEDATYGAGMRLFVRRLGEAGRGRGRAVRH
ncbi:MAG TPA: hypothetical protein VGF28_21535 [Thermoanaerobaculia bacterium]|jgi:hypothetical protein